MDFKNKKQLIIVLVLKKNNNVKIVKVNQLNVVRYKINLFNMNIIMKNKIIS